MWGGGGGGGGLELFFGRPTLAPDSALEHLTKLLQTTTPKRIQQKQKAKRAAGIETYDRTIKNTNDRILKPMIEL